MDMVSGHGPTRHDHAGGIVFELMLGDLYRARGQSPFQGPSWSQSRRGSLAQCVDDRPLTGESGGALVLF